MNSQPLLCILALCLLLSFSKALLPSNTGKTLQSISSFSEISAQQSVCIRYDPQEPSFKNRFSVSQSDKGCVAWAKYNDDRRVSGWGKLWLKSSKTASDNVQAFAIGFAEGLLTHAAIKEFHDIILVRHPNQKQLSEFWSEQIEFVRAQMKENPSDEYWRQARLSLKQLKGILAGYNSMQERRDDHLSIVDIWMASSDVDNFDVEASFKPLADFDSLSRGQLLELLQRHSRCSALLKWTGSDLFVGHATWEDYSEMNRMYKYVTTFYRGKEMTISFSGYPFVPISTDDFITTSNGLIITETTISILDDSVYENKLDASSTIATWFRCLIASQLATSAEEWTELFVRFNSGTNNDQWIIVDSKKVNLKKQQLEEGAVWMVEVLPGFERSRDLTQYLIENEFFASFNIPFLPETVKASKYEEASARHGDHFDYEKAARGRIFAREQRKVHSVEGMKKIMRFNDWENDEFSKGCPHLAIAARYDLRGSDCKEVEGLSEKGAIDAKVTSVKTFPLVWAVSGPSSDDQPPFEFTEKTFPGRKSFPRRWDFEWTMMEQVSLSSE